MRSVCSRPGRQACSRWWPLPRVHTPAKYNLSGGEREGERACPMCGQEHWAGGDRITEIGSIGDVPIETMPFVCVNCGFVRLHAIQPLETLDD